MFKRRILNCCGYCLLAGILPLCAQEQEIDTAQMATAVPATPAVAAKPSESLRSSSSISTLNNMERLDNSTKLKAGDVVSLRIVEDETPPVSLRVKRSGEIEIPYIGLVNAHGKTCQSLAYEVKKLLEIDYYHTATVIMALDSTSVVSPGKVYLAGQVARTGPLSIPADGELTVSQAIIEAGGMGDFADQRKVKLVRKLSPNTDKTKTYIIDVKEIIREGKRKNDMILQPGDYIIVPQRLINF